MDDYPFLNDKEHKDFQHIIGLYQWMVAAGIFELSYTVSSLGRLLDPPWVGHIEMVIRIFGYLEK